MSTTEQRPTGADQEPLGKFARLGMALADWSQKWFPDAFVFALAALLVVFVAGLSAGRGDARSGASISAKVSGA